MFYGGKHDPERSVVQVAIAAHRVPASDPIWPVSRHSLEVVRRPHCHGTAGSVEERNIERNRKVGHDASVVVLPC